MSEAGSKLANPPIIEAVLDIDCDMPPAQEITALEKSARDAFRNGYSRIRPVYLHEAQIGLRAGESPQMSARRGIQAFQFLQDDEKQIVQVRTQGFSFNRLAPYTTLDNYLAEIERAWRLFVGFASPIQVRRIRLRYINRILIPTVAGQVELNDYLKIGPRLPDEEKLIFVSFVNQHVAVEKGTGNQVNIILATQPEEPARLPIVFDIEVSREENVEPENWDVILARVRSLRKLKNLVFRDTLTAKCLEMFQ